MYPRFRSSALFRRIVAAVVLAALAGLAAWAHSRFWLKLLEPVPPRGPVSLIENGGLAYRTPGTQLVGELAQYEDELFAYLMFDYLRSRPSSAGREFLLTYAVVDNRLAYRLIVVLPNDLTTGLPQLFALTSEFPFLSGSWRQIDDRLLPGLRNQNRLFVSAYTSPGYKKLEQLAPREIVAYTRRFIRFKSNTDPRIRRQIEPVLSALSQDQAEQLAEDIVAVAAFYDLPLEFFLGIGAMENNYMNVKGDIGNTIWKRKASPGDVVLRRKGNRVLVLNESSGVWQITRETLRFVHAIYLRDKRDYFALPEGLRPPKNLDVTAVEPRVLTTYSGLLFRELIDRFDGDVNTAVGAYNGGIGRPNAKYATGVGHVAEYARKVLEQAAAIRARTPDGHRELRMARAK